MALPCFYAPNSENADRDLHTHTYNNLSIKAVLRELIAEIRLENVRDAHASLSCRAARRVSQYPVIETTLGSVQGIGSPYRDNVTVYRGIPFAASTAGSKLLEASSNPLPPTFNDPADVKSKQLPVYFWIYGGRFEIRSGDVMTYDGSGFAHKDIIVVTMHYRMGAFEFLAHPELSAESSHNSSGNYGLLGPTVCPPVGGQSAGSASALDMMWSPLTRDKIVGVIAESGARAAGIEFLQEVNARTIAELREASMDTLTEYYFASDATYEGTQFEDLNAFMEPPLWRPVLNGYVLAHTYADALRQNDHGDVPILTGNNKDEGGSSVDPQMRASSYKADFKQMFKNFSSDFFTLYPGRNSTEANQNTNDIFHDIARVGTWQWALNWTAGGANGPVYTCFWTHGAAEEPDNGAYHGSELWYVFDNIPYTDYHNVTWAPIEYSIERQMAAYWANSIKNLDPNADGLTAFPPSTETQQTMWLGNFFGAGPISDNQDRIYLLLARPQVPQQSEQLPG
ncbi:Alpha/Beta hydrolase protein [Aspergillus undulatus]|uniref:Alpha/Beta hydrolase protein n=1 Tax=Aspergillus undulatus TaxID=1810928 RepID=UPI003CCDE7D1